MKYKRLLGYGALGLTLIALGVAFVKPISSSNLLIRARADMSNLSVTFNSSGTQSHIDNYTYYRSANTSLGNTFYLRNRSNINPQSNQVAVMCGNSEKGSIENEIIFTTTNTGTSLFEFRNILSISAVSNSSSTRTLTVFKSSDGTNWNDAGSLAFNSSGGTNTDVSGAKYIKLTYPSAYFTVYITSFTINYSCSDEPGPGKELSSISISGQTTEFTVGDLFEFDGTVTAYYSDLTSKSVSPTSVSSPDMSTEGTKEITVSYTEDDITKTANYNIEVSSAPEGPSGSYSYSYSSYKCTIVFSGKAGTYSFKDWDSSIYSLNFSYSISSSSVTITLTNYASGSSASSFANYRLFDGSATVTTATYNSSTDTMTIKTYTSYGSYSTRTFTKS